MVTRAVDVELSKFPSLCFSLLWLQRKLIWESVIRWSAQHVSSMSTMYKSTWHAMTYSMRRRCPNPGCLQNVAFLSEHCVCLPHFVSSISSLLLNLPTPFQWITFFFVGVNSQQSSNLIHAWVGHRICLGLRRLWVHCYVIYKYCIHMSILLYCHIHVVCKWVPCYNIYKYCIYACTYQIQVSTFTCNWATHVRTHARTRAEYSKVT